MRSLSHISAVHILREISGMQSLVFGRVGRRKVLLGMSLYALLSSPVSLSAIHQK